MNILILGGSGFIGTNLTIALANQNHNIKVFNRQKDTYRTLKFSDFNNIEIVQGDFTNNQDLDKATKNIDVIYHLISTTIPQTSNDNPIYDVESNVISSIHLLQACVKNNVKKIIFISSGGTVYGIPNSIPIKENHTTDPICSYGITKLAIEKYLHLYSRIYNLDSLILRVSNPYGKYQQYHKGQGVITTFLYKALKNEPIEIWGDGCVTRDYIYIDDLTNALVKALNHQGKNKIINLSSNEGTDLNTIIKLIEEVLDKKIFYTKKMARPLDVPVNILDNTIAKTELNWNIDTTLKEGINKTKIWLETIINDKN